MNRNPNNQIMRNQDTFFQRRESNMIIGALTGATLSAFIVIGLLLADSDKEDKMLDVIMIIIGSSAALGFFYGMVFTPPEVSARHQVYL